MWNPNRPSQEYRRRRGWADEEPAEDTAACSDLASEFAQFAGECGVAIWVMKGLAENKLGRVPLADVDKPEHIISCDVLNICSAMAQTGNVPDDLIRLCRRVLAGLDPNRFDPEKLGNPSTEAALAYSLRVSISGTVSTPIALQFLSLHDNMHGGSQARRAASIYSLLVLRVSNFYLPSSIDDPALVAAAYGIANGFFELFKPYLDREDETPSTSEAQPGENRSEEKPHSCSECSKAYQLLELPYGASLDEVQQAQRELAKSLHPDKWGQKRGAHFAEEQLKKINAACDHVAECRAEEQVVRSAQGGSKSQPDKTSNQDQSRAKTEVAAEGWSPLNTTYHHELDSKGSSAWRCIKVVLRTVWRLFKISAVLAMGVLFLIGIIGQLATYWSNEVKREKGELHAEIKSWKTDFYLSNLLGIPLAAVRGLILLSSTLLLILIFIGSMIWETILNHPVLAFGVVGLVVLSCVAWASLREYQSEFVPSISSKAPGAASWVMGLAVLLSTLVGLFFFLPSFRAAAPDAVTSQQPEQQQPAPVLASAPIVPKDPWRPAGAAKHLLVWDFRDVLHENHITDTETLQKLQDAIEPSVTGHVDQFFFYGPLSGDFTGGVGDSHQLLYTAVLNWVAAGRSHADGDLVFAVVLGSATSRVFELDGGGVAIGVLRLPGARQDLVISTPEWSGQGETMTGLSIFALSNERAEKVAEISTVYVDDCASGSPQPLVVADRIYADVDATGHFGFGEKEHWTSPCSPGTPLTLASKGPESAEDVQLRLLKTTDSVPNEGSVVAGPQIVDPGVLDALNQWREAVLSNDANRQIVFYAPHLDRYFLRSNVDRNVVFSDMTAQREQGSSVVSLRMDQVKTTAESDVIADVDFVESVSFIRHGLPRNITVHTFLKFAKIEGTWKIFYVRQLNT